MDILQRFKYEPDGTVRLADALCSFIREEITFGRLKGGERLPTIDEISKNTGLTFSQARSVIERLSREGYVRSRPRVGTCVASVDGGGLKWRVLVAYPDVDICRFYPTQLFDTINLSLSEAGYAVSVVTFPLGADGSLARLKSELLRATDLVIAMRATPNVQKCLAESGIRHLFAYGDRPVVDDGSPWIEFSPDEALAQFADHCEKAGVKHVVQARFENNETMDAGPALLEKGIDSSWLTVSRKDVGRRRFDGIVQCSCEVFSSMQRNEIPDLLLFWSAYIAQGAFMAFLDRGIRIPADIKVVSLSETGFGPAFVKPVTRFESDPVEAGARIAEFALAVLEKRRLPSPPRISPQYVFGETFPF